MLILTIALRELFRNSVNGVTQDVNASQNAVGFLLSLQNEKLKRHHRKKGTPRFTWYSFLGDLKALPREFDELEMALATGWHCYMLASKAH